MLKQFLSNLMNKNEHTISNRYIADMKSINKDLYDIRMRLSELTDIDYAGDIADNISTYEIARHLGDNIEIDVSDLDIDYRDLAERIAGEIGGNIDIDYSDLAREISDFIGLNGINARLNTLQTNLETLERKMDLILKHLGITPENA